MSKSPIHVALVDDDASVRKALGRLLSASNFKIDTYSTARDFIKSLKLIVPQCVVADLQMPDLTGLDLQRHLARAKVKIPIIIITAYNEPGLRERCQSAGVSDLLLKPLDSVNLINAINFAVGLPAGEIEDRPPCT